MGGGITMTNEQKAQQIMGCNRANCLECGGSLSVANGCTEFERIMEMAKWKDEQFAEEKKQWINKACEWLFKNTRFTTNDIRDFKKAMEE